MKKYLLAACFIITSLSSLAKEPIILEDSVIHSRGLSRNEGTTIKANKNIYLVTQETIQEKNYKNVEDVLRDAPGVIIQNTAFGPKIDMRGSGNKSLSRVKVFVDGIRSYGESSYQLYSY